MQRRYNASLEFVDANIARGLGEKVAFSDGERSLTYLELQSRTMKLGGAFRSMGLKQEDRVAILLDDTVDFPTVFWGAARAGIVAVPVNPLLSMEQWEDILNDCRAEVLVASASTIAMLRETIGRACHLGHVVIAGQDRAVVQPFPAKRVHWLEEMIANTPARSDVADTVADETAFWLYTSGSTGDPCGVQHAHSSLIATARNFGQGVLKLISDDIVFSTAKLSFAYGLGNSMSFPMSVGASAVLLPGRPLTDAVIEVIQKRRPTIFFAVPSLYSALLTRLDTSSALATHSLRLCVSAGEALPPDVGKRWRSLVGVDILDGVGSTEMLNTYISNYPGSVKYGSSGRAVPGYDIRIVSDSGLNAGSDETGELMVRGESAAVGYWRQRSRSQRAFRGEWICTGDNFRCDNDGYYYYQGRVDDMFKVDGAWVSPSDVEAALLSHEAILEAAVVGRSDTDGLTKIKAVVVLSSSQRPSELLVEDLKQYVKACVGARLCPRWIEVRQVLPRTATGKIQRRRLREEG
jgi:benzoate-CoA ligase family protein